MLHNKAWERAPAGDWPPAAASPGDPTPPPRRRRRLARLVLFAAFALFLITIGWLLITAPLSRALKPLPQPAIVLLSQEGTPIARRGAMKREPVDVTELPEHVHGAFVAVEDRRFWGHPGIDLRGIARAAWRNVQAGAVVEGGSTITQQLAKTSFLSADRSIRRKLQEVLLAVWLELWLSKEEILSRYLSGIYFGDGVYGLRGAAHHYFDRPPERLTVAQAAMLAGMVKAPSRLAPTKNLEGAQARSRIVIGEMEEAGLITPAQADAFEPATLDLGRAPMPRGTYFADWVFPQAERAFEAEYGDVRVETTLEADLQKAAVQAINAAKLGDAQAALVAMRPDGRVVAMLGGRDYAKTTFNRATQAKRQSGSAFKLFVYLAALREGFRPETLIRDDPITVDGWTPVNHDGRYRGELTLREAFARSSNVAAVRLSETVGRADVIDAARDLGVRSALVTHPSVALGTSSTTLLEMTAAYAAIAGGRYPVRPRGLADTTPSWRERLSTRSIDPDVRRPLLDLLWSSVNEGTGRAAALRTPSFGKTGTTSDNRDAVFIGFAGDLVVGVWVGNDDNSPMKGVSGGGLPARIWRDFMARALATEPDRPGLPAPRRATRRVVVADDAPSEDRGWEREEEPRRGIEAEEAMAAAGAVLAAAEEMLSDPGRIDEERAERAIEALERLGRVLGREREEPSPEPDLRADEREMERELRAMERDLEEALEDAG